ncbi:putative transmembrane protein [Segniliparus rotundus DSM 44985]|uniref:Putative transmembrane protein n=1 Tax=Segniliparus rotundus (strain ATCC BAA-972 / CDC 1076 / CIP 108378 / DSM 44985 / JCM 13578) TaxID=640132 RepID=D6Z934_SEGRD|nr:hypothetical protein [Segniliparus rotundus]ADG98464.1 putative transmembrane protein [Segniliparus rotundus DSM 44985]
MTAPGAARAAHYTYPALGAEQSDGQGASGLAGAGRPFPHAPASPPAQRPEPSGEAWALADAIVRAALARTPSDGARSVFQPGVIPLRPLSLAEIYNGAVAALRSNAKAALAFSVVVLAVGALLQVALLAPALRWALAISGVFSSAAADSSDARSTVSVADFLADAPVAAVAATLIAGFVMPVLARALVSAPGSAPRQAVVSVWRQVRGRGFALFGLSLFVPLSQALIVLLPVAAVLLLAAAGLALPAAVLLLIFAMFVFLPLAYVAGVFLSLSAPAMMSERLGVFAACRRSARVVWRGFWKILGVGLLTRFVTAFVGLSLSLPFTVAAEVFASPGKREGVWAVVVLTLGQLLSRTILMPFTAGVTGLLYVDQRMRQEAYDLVLLGRSGDGADAARVDGISAGDGSADAVGGRGA